MIFKIIFSIFNYFQQHFWTPPYPHSNQFPSSAAFPIQNGSNNFGQFDNRPKSIPNGPSTTPLVANVRHHRPPLPDAFIHSSSTQNTTNSSAKSAQNSPTKMQQKRPRQFEIGEIEGGEGVIEYFLIQFVYFKIIEL
jgi:hypothetical protein